MPKSILLVVTAFFIHYCCACQPLATQVVKKEYSKDQYIDFAICNDTIYALTINNTVKAFKTNGDALNNS